MPLLLPLVAPVCFHVDIDLVQHI